MTSSTLLRHPSAFLPLAMSTGALVVVLGYLGVHGAAPQPDEGAAAHIWQLLMAGQVPIILFFAARWLSETPRQATRVLAIQVAAAVAAAAPVFLLGW